MNKHKNKNKITNAPAANRTEIQFDHPPVEVATQMLCAPLAKLSNRERKVFSAARAKQFCSTLKPKPIEEKLNQKFQRATAQQLQKWLRRANNNRSEVQKAYIRANSEVELLKAKPVDPKSREQIQITGKLLFLERAIDALNLKAAQIDLFRDSLEDEIERRFEFIKGLVRAGVPSVAKKLLWQGKLVVYPANTESKANIC